MLLQYHHALCNSKAVELQISKTGFFRRCYMVQCVKTVAAYKGGRTLSASSEIKGYRLCRSGLG